VVVHVFTPAPGQEWDPRRAWLESYREDNGAVRIQIAALEADLTTMTRLLVAGGQLRDMDIESSGRHAADGADIVVLRAKSVERSKRVRLESADDAAGWVREAERNPFDRIPLPPGTPRAFALDPSTATLLTIVVGSEPLALLTDGSANHFVGAGDLVGAQGCRYRVSAFAKRSVAFTLTADATCASPATLVLKLDP
jgi:hypothetical protein